MSKIMSNICSLPDYRNISTFDRKLAHGRSRPCKTILWVPAAPGVEEPAPLDLAQDPPDEGRELPVRVAGGDRFDGRVV